MSNPFHTMKTFTELCTAILLLLLQRVASLSRPLSEGLCWQVSLNLSIDDPPQGSDSHAQLALLQAGFPPLGKKSTEMNIFLRSLLLQCPLSTSCGRCEFPHWAECVRGLPVPLADQLTLMLLSGDLTNCIQWQQWKLSSHRNAINSYICTANGHSF